MIAAPAVFSKPEFMKRYTAAVAAAAARKAMESDLVEEFFDSNHTASVPFE